MSCMLYGPVILSAFASFVVIFSTCRHKGQLRLIP